MKFTIFPPNAEYWFVAFAYIVIIMVSAYGATFAGYQTGPSLFNLMREPFEHPTNNVVVSNNSPTEDTVVELPVTTTTPIKNGSYRPTITGYSKTTGYSVV